MQGLSMGKGGLFQKSFIRVRARKNRMLPPLEAGPVISSGLPEKRKKPVLPPEILMDAWRASAGNGSLLSPGCFICRTGVKAGKTPLNGPGRGQKGKDGGFSHADEQACSRYVWQRTLPPGGTSASRPPWPCFSNGTYFP